jgi:hypothetical protein
MELIARNFWLKSMMKGTYGAFLMVCSVLLTTCSQLTGSSFSRQLRTVCAIKICLSKAQGLPIPLASPYRYRKGRLGSNDRTTRWCRRSTICPDRRFQSEDSISASLQYFAVSIKQNHGFCQRSSENPTSRSTRCEMGYGRRSLHQGILRSQEQIRRRLVSPISRAKVGQRHGEEFNVF